MSAKDSELGDLFREAPSQLAQDNFQPDSGDGRGRRRFTRTHGSGFAVTLRVKPDRRSVVTYVDPSFERRRRCIASELATHY
jgi:hypothetical protein